MSASRRPALPIPPPLRGLERHTFTYFSIVERLPRILRRVLESNDYGAPVAGRLQRLLEGIPQQPIRPLHDASAPDAAEWEQYVAPYVGQSWLQAPWFFVETYFYRRILEATGYIGGTAGDANDPFAPQKAESLHAQWAAIYRQAEQMARAESDGNGRLGPRLAFSLWGNQGDLSMWPAGVEEQPDDADGENDRRSDYLVVDDTAAVAGHLPAGGQRRVDLLMDNSGLELVSDLMLVDYLLVTRRAREIWLHVKSHPLFVSDALAGDVRDTAAALAGSEHAPTRALGGRLRDYLSSERLHLRPHPFWTSPLAGWQMPAELHAFLSGSDLVISKGDANYRRLLGDRHWSFSAPLPALLAYFPAPLLLARTLKSHVGAGIPPARQAAAQARDVAWTVSGLWGLMQFVP